MYNNNMKLLSIIAGIALLLAIIPSWAYGYYILLRWFIFISSIIIAYKFYRSKLTGWTLVFGAIAFLFNPLFPIYLSRSTWAPIDLVAGVLFFISAYSLKRRVVK